MQSSKLSLGNFYSGRSDTLCTCNKGTWDLAEIMPSAYGPWACVLGKSLMLFAHVTTIPVGR